jgi:hypothetical protein
MAASGVPGFGLLIFHTYVRVRVRVKVGVRVGVRVTVRVRVWNR